MRLNEVEGQFVLSIEYSFSIYHKVLTISSVSPEIPRSFIKADSCTFCRAESAKYRRT